MRHSATTGAHPNHGRELAPLRRPREVPLGLQFPGLSRRKAIRALIAHEYDAFRQATGRRECYIATVAVTKAARGRGIASALIRRSLAAAHADGCTVATLYVDADSPTGALALYEHTGFTRQRTSVTLIKDLAEH